MISDCRCKGAELVLCSRAHTQNTRSFIKRAGNRYGVVHVRVALVFPSLPPCLCCTSRPLRRPAADLNLSAASSRVLHHPRQDRRTSGLGRAHNVCFWVPDTSLTWFCTQRRVINLKQGKKEDGKLVLLPSVDELNWSHRLIIRISPT